MKTEDLSRMIERVVVFATLMDVFILVHFPTTVMPVPVWRWRVWLLIVGLVLVVNTWREVMK